MKSLSILIAATVAVIGLSQALPLTRVDAHSWVACSDYSGDASKYEASACKSFPRQFTSVYSHETFGGQGGFNYDGGQSCRDKGRATKDSEIAKYEQGQIYCLAWMTQNHVASSKNIYLPDTSTRMYISSKSDPSQAEFKQQELQTNFGVHTDKKVDCLGFQRAPQFGNDPGTALATGCFLMDKPPGDYTLQWYWEFNPGASPYKTCMDATVTAPTGRQASIPLKNYQNIADTLGDGGQTCANNWAIADAAFLAKVKNVAPSGGSNQQQQQQQQQKQGQKGGSNSQTVAQKLNERIQGLEFMQNSQAAIIQDLLDKIKAMQR